MKARWLLNLVLLVAVIGLATAAWFKPWHHAPAEYRLSALNAATVTTIRLQHSGEPAATLEKRDGSWRIIAPFPAPADRFEVDHLLAVLGVKTHERLAATDLSRFDLDQPQTRLTIDGQHFSFGTVNTLWNKQYVETGNAIYLIPARYGAALPGTADDLINRQLLGANEVPVAFTFPDFSLAQQDGSWRATPRRTDLSQDDFNRLVNTWRHAQAFAAQPASGKAALGHITIKFKDGRTLALGILEKQPNLVLLRPDRKIEYRFPPAVAARMLKLPAAESAKP
jgi:hypothetical protein